MGGGVIMSNDFKVIIELPDGEVKSFVGADAAEVDLKVDEFLAEEFPEL